MKTHKHILSLTIIALLLFSYNSLFAHYGARGLLGGSLHVGIEYNGIVYFGSEDAGVFESTNTQLTGWRLRAVGLKSGKITALAHSGTELYAATADSGIYIFNGFAGSDRFWNERNNGLGTLNILSLLAVNSTTLYAGTEADGLYKTTDQGLNWTAVNSNLLNGESITALLIGGNRLFALVADGSVVVSDDNGTTWTSLNDVNTLNVLESNYFSYNASTDELLVSNANGLFVLASASTTNSPVYTAASTGLPNPIHIHSVTNNGTNWYVASHDGVFFTAAASINWAAANTGLTTDNVGVVVAVGDTIVAGTNKKGVFKSNAATINWSAFNPGLTNIETYSVVGIGDSIVVAATEYGVTVSTLVGNSPVISNNGLTDSLNVNDVEAGQNLLFTVTKNDGVFVSSNLGANWTTRNGGLTNLNIVKVIYGNDRVYIIDNDGKLFQCDLNGTTWTDANAGLPLNTVVTSLAFSANNLAIGTLGNGVYVKSRDASSWTVFSNGLSNLDVTGVAVSDGKLFAGTDGSGVFVTDAGADAWTSTSTITSDHFAYVPGYPNSIQYLTAIKGYVVASFHGGLVSTDDNGVTWNETGTQFNLPSYSDYNKISFTELRILVTTDANSIQTNGISELPLNDTILVANDPVVTAPAGGITSYHTVTSNIKWAISSSENWVTLSADSGLWNQNISLVIAPNLGTARTAIVTLTRGTYSATITINQDGTVGMDEENTVNEIQLYPNPNNGTFTLDANGHNLNSISVFDMSGKLLYAVANPQQKQFALNLASGIYVMEAVTENRIVRQKLVIK